MKKRIFQLFQFAISFVLITSFALGQVIEVFASSAPTPFIQLAWFYKPPKNRNLDDLTQKFHRFILTKADEPVRDYLKERGVTSPVLRYLLFNEIEDPGSCNAKPNRNQVADLPGDFCKIATEHPDWFLQDKDERPISHMRGRKKLVYMDPGNQQWRDYWLQRARQNQEELKWDGIFLDNIEASLNKFRRLNRLPSRYPTDTEYAVEIEEFLSYVRRSYFGPKNVPLEGNIVEVNDGSVWYRYLRYLDGAMMESFAVGWNSNYRSEKEWEEGLQTAEKTQELGKSLIVVSQGTRDDLRRQEFAFASFLLISKGRAFFRYTHSDYYHENWVYDNYSVNLGSPKGERFKDGAGWRRNFTRGWVTVNPVTRLAAIQLTGEEQN